jgi:flagellar assembly protein FliH
LSNVIKPHSYVALDQSLKIESVVYRPPAPSGAGDAASEQEAEKQSGLEAAAERIVSDAKLAAQEQLKLAAEETLAMREAAEAEIETWWNERRLEDLRIVEESRNNGFEAGYREGLELAQRELSERFESMIAEAAALVNDAHRVKETIIAEAEPFLVELSLGIARKIIGNHVDSYPDWTIEHVKKTLERRKEKGVITLCVSPSQFVKLQDARQELMLATDSQAELQIVPDNTVDDGGCVVRTSFGSIDARLDTQLAELKSVLLEIATANESE